MDTNPAVLQSTSGIVAALEPVRAAIRDTQRAFAASPPGGKKGAVLDGRDIGTVICPDADVKLYVVASPEVRAKRRFLDHQAGARTGEEPKTEEMILEELKARVPTN